MEASSAGHLESRHMGWDSNKIWHLNHNMQREDVYWEGMDRKRERGEEEERRRKRE